MILKHASILVVIVSVSLIGCESQTQPAKKKANLVPITITPNQQTDSLTQKTSEAEPQNEKPAGAQQMFMDAVRLARAGKSQQAIDLFHKVLKKEPRASASYYHLGREYFRLGDFQKSIVNFDRFIKMQPSLADSLWERGITLYYLKRYKEGAAQFRDYQNYHDKDVENAVWQFLCAAKSDGLETARKNLLQIEDDSRVPMMEIYQLFKGEKTPQDVIDASNRQAQSVPQADIQSFYANLYLALYFDAIGKQQDAKKHIDLAVAYQLDGEPPKNNYMWDTARIHQQFLQSQGK